MIARTWPGMVETRIFFPLIHVGDEAESDDTRDRLQHREPANAFHTRLLLDFVDMPKSTAIGATALNPVVR